MKKDGTVLIALFAALASASASAFVPAFAQYSADAPPVAPPRQSRNQSSSISAPSNYRSIQNGSVQPVSVQPVSVQNGSVLNGSVTSGATIGGVRLNRPVAPAMTSGVNMSGANVSGASAPVAAPAPTSTRLFSAADQAAFSYVPPVNVGAASATSTASSNSAAFSASANKSAPAPVQKANADFDLSKAFSFGASVMNQMRGSGTSLFKPAFVSKFAVPLSAQDLNRLSQYDVVLVIDQSGSMDERDCPGGMSRWDWCRDQMMSLTAQIAAVFKNGITVALYSSDYEIFRNVDLGYVTRIFAEHGPAGATFTGKTVQAVLDDYFARKSTNSAATRNLLVQVVTDGDPSDKGNLIAAITRATQQIRSPQEITINFIQIGNESAGANTLAKLDRDLAREGAQFDIVKVVPFGSVAQTGLPRALVDATR